MKTKSENIRLFEEARSLRDDARFNLHAKATNAPLKQRETVQIARAKMHNRSNKPGLPKG